MKKILFFNAIALSAIIILSCNKENTYISQELDINDAKASEKEELASPITLKVTTEATEEPTTKVSIVENGAKFALNWEGTETFVIANSANTIAAKGDNTFTVSSYSGTSAEFTGTLPDAGSGSVNYIGAFNFYSSTSTKVRADLPFVQSYSAGGALATNCLLIARADGCTAGTLEKLDFKTMNSFIKFSLKKGAAAAGSSNDYTKMFVQSIKVETVQDGEVLAGRFGFNKTGSWGTVYDETVSGTEKSVVTLNCVTGTYANGVELSDSDTDFYVAVAFGTFSKGLKVTITVKNQDDEYGTYQRTISNGKSYDIERNQLIAMPSLTVNPEDAATETVLWTENWTGGVADATPSAYMSRDAHTGTYVYNSESITYSQSSGSNVKLYTEGTMYAGGTSPELYIKKSATWTVSNIPTTGASKLALTYKSNNTNNTVSTKTTGATITGSSKSYIINTGGASTITLVFTASGGNTRIDDVELKVTN